MKKLNSIDTTFIKGELRFQGADDIGINSTVTLSSKSKEIEEFSRSPVIDLVALYDKERQKSAKYVPTAKFQFIFKNSYSGQCAYNQGQIYEPFNNNLYYVNEEYYRALSTVNGTQQVIPWGGFPQYQEFSFLRTDNNSVGYTSGDNPHVNFVNKNLDKYNWYIQSSYVDSHDDNVPMSYDVDGVEINFTSGNGIPYKMNITKSNGKRVWKFTCPVDHGLESGEFVELDFSYNGKSVFEVYSLGDGLFGSEKKIFTIIDIGYIGDTTFFNNRTGQFKRILNSDFSAETKSRYYVRVHKILTDYTATTITKTGFDQNAFRNVRKRVIPATSPNINNTNESTSFKEGADSYNVSFNNFVSIKDLLDNQKRPVSELFFTVINRGYFGWFHPSRDLSTVSLKQGWEFNLGSGQTPTNWWDRNKSESYTNLEFETNLKNVDGKQFAFNYTKPLSVGDLVYGDFCEWNDYEQKERVISDYYHKIVYNQSLFSINTNMSNPVGYYHKVHYPIQIRVFSEYIEEKPAKITSGIPSYAYYNEINDTFIWRDLYPFGFIDGDNVGVDFPFMNGKHYPYENFIFKLRGEDKILSGTINEVQEPTVDGCE